MTAEATPGEWTQKQIGDALRRGVPLDEIPFRTFQGRVTIEWPQPDPGSHVMQAWKVTIRDADTDGYITTAHAVTIDAGPDGWIVAELSQFLGMDGQPLREGLPDPVTGRIPDIVLDIGDDGKPKTAVFRYLVTGMRVRGS